MVSILFDLYLPKKVAPPLIRVPKNFFKIVRKGYQKKLISKMCRSIEFIKRGKILWKRLDARVLHIFEINANSASFDTLCAQF
jgi:hypothetical protein